ncbi:MAG: hypothetical protein ACI4N3_03175 [Alphaproteobacteria bacterium]
MNKVLYNENQELFNSFLNFKSFSVYMNEPFKKAFEVLKKEFFSERFKDINGGNINKNIAEDELVPFFDNIRSGFANFYEVMLKSFNIVNPVFTFTLFIDYSMVSLLNEGGIDISKTDVFKDDRDIYRKCYSMNPSDYKAYLKKYDSLDPVDLVTFYYPYNSSFKIYKTKNENEYKVFSLHEDNVGVKQLLSFNENAYKSFYDFYKFGAFSSKMIDKYRLFTVVKGAKNKDELLRNVSNLNNEIEVSFNVNVNIYSGKKKGFVYELSKMFLR